MEKGKIVIGFYFVVKILLRLLGVAIIPFLILGSALCVVWWAVGWIFVGKKHEEQSENMIFFIWDAPYGWISKKIENIDIICETLS